MTAPEAMTNQQLHEEMIKRFDALDGRLDGIDGHIRAIKERLGKVEGDIGQMKDRLTPFLGTWRTR